MEKVSPPIKTKIAILIYALIIGPITSFSGFSALMLSMTLQPSAKSEILIMGVLLLLLGLLVIIFNFLLLTKKKKVYWWLVLITHFPNLIVGIFLLLLGLEELEEFAFLILVFTIPVILIFTLLLLDRKNFWKVAT